MAARMSCFEGHLPRAGGLEDQDSMLLDALVALHHEQAHLSLVLAEERANGRV